MVISFQGTKVKGAFILAKVLTVGKRLIKRMRILSSTSYVVVLCVALSCIVFSV